MTTSTARPSLLWTIAWIGGAAMLATILFAPLVTVGFCADGVKTEDTYCGSYSQSIVGIESTFWIWLGASAGFGIIGWLVSLAVWRPRAADRAPDGQLTSR